MFNTIQGALEDTLAELDKIPRINEGGCAVVALSLYHTLQSLGFDCRIACMSYRSRFNRPSEYNPHWMEDDASPYGCPHAMVHLYYGGEEYFIDSEGIHHKDCVISEEYDRLPIALFDIEDLTEQVKDIRSWNSSFNPQYRPKIRGTISSFRKWAIRSINHGQD